MYCSEYFKLLKDSKGKYTRHGIIFMVIPDNDTDNRMGIDFETTIFEEGGYDDFSEFGKKGMYVWGQYNKHAHQAFPIKNIIKIGRL